MVVAGAAGPGGFVVATDLGLAVGFGAPEAALLGELRAAGANAAVERGGLKLHLPAACAADWLALDGVSDLGQNRVQQLSETAQLPALVRHEVRLVKEREDSCLQTLPPDLAEELTRLDPWPVVMCALQHERVTSVAYAFLETESHFDLSIDTVQFFRREGYGTSCAAALILHQAARGKRAVWIASERSRASLALSARLGFEDVGAVQAAHLR